MKRLAFLILLVMVLPCNAWGACNPDIYDVSSYDNVLFVTDTIDSAYYDPDNDSVTEGGDDCRCEDTISEADQWLDGISSGTTIILFRKGDVWTSGRSGSTWLDIDISDVYIDAYGTGNLPKFDGQGSQPSGLTSSGIPYGTFISVGDSSPTEIDNVYVNNLWFYNGYPGSGILVNGVATGTNGKYSGVGSIKNCTFEDIGWAAITIYHVNNSTFDVATAFSVEYNTVTDTGNYPETEGWTSGGWPQAIATMSGTTKGNICRYNTISNIYGEGIGGGYMLIEGNVIYDTRSPGIYVSQKDQNCIIRDNVIYGSSYGNFQSRMTGIAFDTESDSSYSTYSLNIYGNVVAGTAIGLKIRNNINDLSTMGPVRIFNNTLIDNGYNYTIANATRFSDTDVSIIHL